MEPLLVEMKGITKQFPGVLALNKWISPYKKRKSLGLFGEMGREITLMKILTGVYTADTGEILYKGAPLVLKNTGMPIVRG